MTSLMRALVLWLLMATPASAMAMATLTPTPTPSCSSAAERAACPYCCQQPTATPTPYVQGRKSLGFPHRTATATPTKSATPTATPTPLIPAVCTHQAGVEFTSLFNTSLSPIQANCPGFAATRLDQPVFTTLAPKTTPTELGFDNSLSQGHNGQVDYFGNVKFTNPSTTTTATLTVTVYIGPTSGACDWTDPADCGGLYSETTKWQIVPNQTATIPFHEFVPATWPTVEYMFLTASTTAPLTDCAVQYQSTECGGTVN